MPMDALEGLTQLFKSFDKDNSGHISINELRIGLKKMHLQADSHALAMLQINRVGFWDSVQHSPLKLGTRQSDEAWLPSALANRVGMEECGQGRCHTSTKKGWCQAKDGGGARRNNQGS